MISRVLRHLSLLAVLVLILLGINAALAASNTVPETGVDDISIPITPNDLKPPECSSISVTNLIVGSGSINGTNASDLILGSASADTVSARPGDDCVVSGDGNDVLDGRQGNDVLIAGAGNDALSGGQGSNDVCYGGPGTDTTDGTCETVVDIP